jgi:cyanase
MPLCTMGATMGANVRVGLEDSIYLGPGELARSNAEQVAYVYGNTIKAIIHEKFGDGIMSAIDFDLSVERIEDPKGDRVQVTMSGKFLPYKRW